MRWLEFRASFSRVRAGVRATKRLGTGLILPLLALALVSQPHEARAYALSGEGRVVRVDAVVVWDGEKQVLALLPQLYSVQEGAVMLVAVPPGAEVMLAPDPDMFQAPDPEGEGTDEGEGEAARSDADSGDAPGSAKSPRVESRRPFVGRGLELDKSTEPGEGEPSVRPRITRELTVGRGDPEPDEPAASAGEDEGPGRPPMDIRDRVSRSGLERRRLPVHGRGQVLPGRDRDLRRPVDRARIIAALRQRQPPLVRLEEDPVILPAEGLIAALREALGDERYEALPTSAIEDYARAGWGVALMRVPAHDGRFRFGPLAFSMGMERPTIPVKLAARAGRHQLSIRFISAEEIIELGEAAATIGLRHTQRPVQVDAALGAWMNAVGFDSGRPWRVHGLGTGPLNTVQHPLSAMVDDLFLPVPPRAPPEPEVEVAPVPEKKTGRGCGCMVADVSSGFASSFVFLLFLFMVLRRRRLRAGC